MKALAAVLIAAGTIGGGAYGASELVTPDESTPSDIAPAPNREAVSPDYNEPTGGSSSSDTSDGVDPYNGYDAGLENSYESPS